MNTPTAADRIAALVARVNELGRRSEDAEVCWAGPCAESAIVAVEAALGTVHGDTLHYRQASWPSPLPPHLVVIQRSLDDNEPFCLDTSRAVAGKHPVVLHYHRTRAVHVDRIAPSFIDFLEKYLEPHFEAEGRLP